MTFNSSVFFVFFIIFFCLYTAVRKRSARRLLILAGSYVFYGYWNVPLCSLIIVSTLTDFVASGQIDKSTDPKTRRAWLTLSVVVNLGILATFKYAGFFMDSFYAMTEGLGMDLGGSPAIRLILPIGISFYTFQTMGYTIDVYRGKLRAERNFINFATYVAFFPQLVAGPIERGGNLLPQIRRIPGPSLKGITEGMPRVLFGLFKKVVIADNIGSMVDAIFGNVAGVHSLALWIAMYGFAVQIYCDFSGYCDIAIGIARMMGFKLSENFRSPYGATSVSDFWRRWHITLSTWIRDYLYIPLGGSKGTMPRRILVLTVTMGLAGLWHGASWNFVAWGLYHGILLALYHAIRAGRAGVLGRKPPEEPRSRLARAGSVALTFHLVCFGWVLFRMPSLAAALDVWGRMLSVFWTLGAEVLRQMFLSATTPEMLLTLVVIGLIVLRQMALKDRPLVTLSEKMPAPALGAAYSVMVAMVLVLAKVSGPEFIYFQF